MGLDVRLLSGEPSRGLRADGSAKTFGEARAAFEAAWRSVSLASSGHVYEAHILYEE
jgi:hypothetical protein